MENLVIYNSLRSVPTEAQKKITGGRLAGMTDIKPMWRIEKLTETFGAAGYGWYAPITNKEIIEGANGERIATVDINLFVNYKIPFELKEDLWSQAIYGTGGSSFIAKERNGLYTSDECFKMAYTDALSVACKMLGMGADVYWGDSKYNEIKLVETEKEAREIQITFGKHKGKTLGELYDSKETKYLQWLFDKTNNENLKKGVSILTGLVDLDPEETKKIVNEMPITEVQKQRLKDKYKSNLDQLQIKMASLGKLKLADLTYQEANKLLGDES